MGLAKKANAPITAVISRAEVEAMPSVQEALAEYGPTNGPTKAGSGTDAALARLSKPEAEQRRDAAITKPAYKQRDFDAEARGKTRCVQFEAALMSPAIAGMQFNTMEEYLKLVKQAADAGVAYTFGE